MLFFGIELPRILEKCREIRCASLQCYFGQVRRVVAPLTQERMAVDAVVLVPDILPSDDLRRKLVFIRERGKPRVAVDRQSNKYGSSYKSADNKKSRPCRFVIRALLQKLDNQRAANLHADPAPVFE